MTQIPIGDLGVNYRKPLPDSKESLGGPGTELLIKERSKQKKAIGISHLYVMMCCTVHYLHTTSSFNID